MKKYLITALLAIITTQSSAQGTHASCKQLNLYQDCMNKANLKINICESKSADPPEYYDCLCEAQKSQVFCYTYCPEDQGLQLELMQKQMAFGTTCERAKEMRSTMMASKTSTSSTMMSTASKTRPPNTATGAPPTIEATTTKESKTNTGQPIATSTNAPIIISSSSDPLTTNLIIVLIASVTLVVNNVLSFML